VPRRLAHEAKAGEVARLAHGPLILLGARGFIAGEVKVAEGGTCSRHHLLELLLILLIPEVVLLTLTLVAGVVLVVVVVLVGGVELLPLGAVGNEVGDVTALEAVPRRPPHLLVEAVHKEDKANSKADESIVLVGLATWLPTRVLVTKALLIREASWFGRPFLDNS
jgi:hypothetical protein